MRKALRSVLITIAATSLCAAGANVALAQSAAPANTTFEGNICDNTTGGCLKASPSEVTVDGATNWNRIDAGDINGQPYYEFEQYGTTNCLTWNSSPDTLYVIPCNFRASQKWHPTVSGGFRTFYNDYSGQLVCMANVNNVAKMEHPCDTWYYYSS